MNSNKIPMFATANNTNKWAVCVDGKFGLFDNKEEADKCYETATKENDISDSPFGSMQLIGPGYRPINMLAGGEDMTRAYLSDFEPIDIEKYITNKWASDSETDGEQIDDNDNLSIFERFLLSENK